MQKSLFSYFARITGQATLSKGTPAILTASRTLTDADCGTVLVSTSATAVTLTVPAGLAPGFNIKVVQSGAGAVTIAAGAGATVANVSSYTKTSGVNSEVGITNKALNAYILTGAGAA
jgi:hypothetical protein